MCEWFSNSFIASFVFIVLLLSMDFWTVKNITGRLMVGLRWWNYVDDNGKSHWVFESRKVNKCFYKCSNCPFRFNRFLIDPFLQGQLQNRVNDKEATIFWMALISTPVVWALFFIIALFALKLKWLVRYFKTMFEKMLHNLLCCSYL